MVEYALLVSIVAVLSIPALAMAGRETEKTMTTVAEAFEQPGGGPVSGGPGHDDGGGYDTGNPGSDTGNPGSDTGNPGGDTGNPGGDTGNPGGDTGNPGNGSGSGGPNESPGPEASWEAGTPSATIVKTASQNHWWTATLPLMNSGTEELFFEIVVTTVDEKGNTSSETLEVRVAPGESLEFTTDSMKMQDHRNKGLNGTVAVTIEVMSATTADGEAAPGPAGPITIEHPALP